MAEASRPRAPRISEIKRSTHYLLFISEFCAICGNFTYGTQYGK
jgi:hypothetical protein